MKRLVYDFKTSSLVWKNWIPEVTQDFGASCVKKQKYVSDTVRINNNEVSTGTTRTALYTMPGGVDNGVRYSALYESSGLDVTELEANKRVIQEAKNKASELIKEEFDKISTETANKVSMKDSQTNTSSSSSSDS